MSQYNLNRIFNPRQVAVVGASEKAGTIGNALMKNLIDGGFSGTVLPVNPKYKTIHGQDMLRIGFRPGDGRGPGDYRHADAQRCRYRRANASKKRSAAPLSFRRGERRSVKRAGR